MDSLHFVLPPESCGGYGEERISLERVLTDHGRRIASDIIAPQIAQILLPREGETVVLSGRGLDARYTASCIASELGLFPQNVTHLWGLTTDVADEHISKFAESAGSFLKRSLESVPEEHVVAVGTPFVYAALRSAFPHNTDETPHYAGVGQVTELNLSNQM